MTTSGNGPGGTLDVDPAKLGAAAGVLESVAGSLAGGAPRLRQQPDAGASSDEVGTALASIAAAVAAVAEEVSSVAEGVRTSAADYATTDQAVSASMQQRRGALAQ